MTFQRKAKWSSSILLRAIMALDHRKLIRPGKKIPAEFFAFNKSCQQIWVRVNQPFLSFIHHIWGETEALFLSYRPRTTEWSTSQFCNTNCYHSIFRTIEARWALAKPLKKSHLYGQPVLTFAVLAVAIVWMNIDRVTLQHNKELIMFIFYFKIV